MGSACRVDASRVGQVNLRLERKLLLREAPLLTEAADVPVQDSSALPLSDAAEDRSGDTAAGKLVKIEGRGTRLAPH